MSLSRLVLVVSFSVAGIACSVSATTVQNDAGQGSGGASATGGVTASGGRTAVTAGGSGGSGGSSSGGAPTGTGGVTFDDRLDAAQDPEIFCDTATPPGQTVIGPCATGIVLDMGLAGPLPVPGGSRCTSTNYSLTLTTQVLEWTRCTADPDPLQAWHSDSGGRQLSDAELASLLAALDAAIVSSAEPCAITMNLPTLTIVTRRTSTKYLDSRGSCKGQETFGPYVDHLDAARAAFDSYSH